MADFLTYLEDVTLDLSRQWPDNEAVNIVCHGHSVPSGYFATPFVDPFHAYPHLLHRKIKERFPFAVVNVIVTAIGGENSVEGARRFRQEVLCHRPRVLTLDYGLNDRPIGLAAAEDAWSRMIEEALAQDVRVILMTPTWDNSYYTQGPDWQALSAHADQIRRLARRYDVGLADVFSTFEARVHQPSQLTELLSHGNHPTALGHDLAAGEIAKFFPAR